MDLKQCYIGIELGSTRIKAVMIDAKGIPLASGDFTWENHLEDGVWTYSLEEVQTGMQAAFAALKEDVLKKYHLSLTSAGGIGISAMMHGYLAFDSADTLLVPFRTWRNTMTRQASEQLTSLFGVNIPQRWSIAHLYQAMLRQEPHVGRISFLTTLAGYVHYQLTGRKVLGIGDASGMFPIDSSAKDYDAACLEKFDALAVKQPWKLKDILPEVLTAGQAAGCLTEAGALWLDPSGSLEAGIPFCPPEGDAGTGMTATNAVAPRTGNVSAGTSIFAMVVLEQPLSCARDEIDPVTTPSGAPVAMVHCNNCTSDLNAWVGLLKEAMPEEKDIYSRLFRLSLDGEPDCGGIVPVNYYSGESVTHLDSGMPLLLRGPQSHLTLANLMRAHIYSAFATLTLGLRLLDNVTIDSLTGHGGLFKTPGVGQRYLAAAAKAPVSVMETAGEGGAWGMALLAAYAGHKEPLENWLADEIFSGMPVHTIAPEEKDVEGFEAFLQNYRQALAAEESALKWGQENA